MKDICIVQDNSTESIAFIGEILGAAGINIEGLTFAACDDHRVIRFLVEDDVTATQVIERAGLRIREVSDVFILHKDKKRVTGKPGSFGGICRLFETNGLDTQLKTTGLFLALTTLRKLRNCWRNGTVLG